MELGESRVPESFPANRTYLDFLRKDPQFRCWHCIDINQNGAALTANVFDTKMKGTADIMISEVDSAKPGCANVATGVFDVMPTESRAAGYAELLAASSLSSYPVLVVLSNLDDYNEVFWWTTAYCKPTIIQATMSLKLIFEVVKLHLLLMERCLGSVSKAT
ncbi:hypothetical protein DFJ73DRAFT_22556 [Zopfochytrium polystomum]|nr:hypothetical protein DFJ73DRAFT_22556 [Zopfochytrium polystomum]